MTAWRASLVGFALSAALLVGIGWLAFSRITELTTANAAVEHTLLVRATAEGLLSLLKDAETGQRGFVITAAPEYLEPYTAALAALPSQIVEFRRLTADNPTQQANIAVLEGLIDRRLIILREGIAARRESGFPAAAERVQQGEGKRVMDTARASVARILSEEDRLMVGRAQAQEQRTRQVLNASVGGLSAAFLVLVAAIAFMARAVTERERASAKQVAAEAVTSAVQKSEEHLRVTLTSIGDAVITTDERGHVTRLNAVAESLTGWTQSAASGRPVADIFVIVNEETRQTVESPVDKVLREGRIVGLANHTILIARDSRETFIDDSAAPIRSATGETLGVVLVFRDITERRQTDRELLMARERLAQFVEHVPCLLWEAWGEPDAADQRIDFVSAHVETMLGYTVEEWLATPNFWLTILHPEDKDAAVSAAAAAYRTGDVHTNRFRWIAKDGRTVAVETRATVIKDATGASIGMRGVTVATA